MNTARLIHQQAVQIWRPLLVCLGLIMVLPLEEAVVNALNGDGFYSSDLAWATYALAPLLAGLIACAAVQADLDERLYSFWRSKPVGVKFFMAMKYAVGLCLTLAVLAVPALFGILTTAVVEPREEVRGVGYGLLAVGLVSLLGYSLCFLCNVVIRKTARAWLVGMAGLLLLLLIPFLLPLGYRDVFTDVLQGMPSVYLAIILVGTAAAFAAALAAVRRDWRVETNLKWMLWAGAGVAFSLLMLFAGQVANIRVLDTEDFASYGGDDIRQVDGEILLQGRYGISVQDASLDLTEYDRLPTWTAMTLLQGAPPPYATDSRPEVITYPRDFIFMQRSDQLYAFALFGYYREEKTEDRSGRIQKDRIYEKVYLRSFRVADEKFEALATLDLSDCLNPDSFRYMFMRRVDGKIAALVGDQAVTIDVSNPAALEVIDRRPVRRFYFEWFPETETFTIPLFPAEGIDLEERIRFSIDFYHRWFLADKHSIVEIHDGEIDYYLDSEAGVFRYRVTGWDDESVYTRRQAVRPFTIIEKVLSETDGWNILFVKDGRLYEVGSRNLLVFDVRSERIRKIGHFERIADDFYIQGAAVTPGGQILLTADRGGREFADGRRESYGTLYLLERPE